MKKIISFLLVVSVLSVSLFGCYSQASSVNNPGNEKITEKQAKLYDKLFGSGNWYIDDGGVIHGGDDTETNKYTKILDKFLARCALPSKFVAPYEDAMHFFQQLYMNSNNGNTEINNWFNKYDDSINVSDSGDVSINADAMQGFRDSLSDQVYSLGCYKLFTPSMSQDAFMKFLNNECSGVAVGSFESYIKKYRFCISGRIVNGSYEYRDCFYFSPFSDTSYSYFLTDNNFSNSYYTINAYNADLKLYNPSLVEYYYQVGTNIVKYQSNQSNMIYKKWLSSSFICVGEPIKIFSSIDSAKYYFKSLYGDSTPSSYIVNNYTPSDITFNINNNYNYKDILNNTYNTINNQKNTTISENGSITEEELQKIIKDAIDAAIKETGGSDSSSGGGSGGSSGGGSGGSSGGGVSSDLLGSILEYVKKIYTICQTSDTRLETLVKVAQANQETFSNIFGAVKDIRVAIDGLGVPLDNIEKYLKSINDKIDELLGSDDSGGSLFDRILDFLSRLTSDLLADLLGDVIKTIIGDLDSVTGPAKALADAAQSKFPTSIPWDIVAILGVMSADPECPKFEIPFSIPRLGINETIKIDLSDAEKVAELSRNMLTVTFLLFLVIQTRKIYGSMSKN